MATKSNFNMPVRADLRFAQEMIDFIGRSPTPYHAVSNMVDRLQDAAYEEQKPGRNSIEGGRYYFKRNDSSLVVVSRNAPLEQGFALIGAHTDSPCLKLKPNAAYENQGYLQLGVEVYGGALLSPWFDRDLSLAGRLTVADKKGKLHNRLIDFKRAIASIPSLAIHLNRKANDENPIDRQKHLPALLDVVDETPDFQHFLMSQLGEQYPDDHFARVLAYELSLYDTQAPSVIGSGNGLVASARLDNLLSCYVGLRALLEASEHCNCVLVLSDHEEVGSATAAGAAGPFLESVLRQMCGDESTFRRVIDASMLVSADNAHAVHPNYADLHEPAHLPKINAGPVIKINNNQRYATNSETQAIFAQLCEGEDIPYQKFVVRSDMACGSTIGPIVATELGIRTVDIGAPQLAMHSIRELAGVADSYYLFRALTAFYNTSGFEIA